MKKAFRLSWLIYLVFFYSCGKGYYIKLVGDSFIEPVYKINRVSNRVVYFQRTKRSPIDTIGFSAVSHYGKRSFKDYLSRRSFDNYSTDYGESYRGTSGKGTIFVRSHTRRLKSGKVVPVKSHKRSRKKW